MGLSPANGSDEQIPCKLIVKTLSEGRDLLIAYFINTVDPNGNRALRPSFSTALSEPSR